MHGVIAARIDLLDARARNALRRCSVIGRVFWPSALDVPDEEIAPLARRGLVSPNAQSVMGGLQEFAFKHSLTRDVAYGSLPRGERRELHRRVAEWIQHVAPDRGLESAELAAYHYHQAIAYGEDDEEVVRRAHALFLPAGRSAMSRGALVAARTHFEHAVGLDIDDERRTAALLATAELDGMEALWDVALDRLDAARELVRADDRRMQSALLALRSRVCWMVGRWDEALEAANGAVSALTGLPESEQLARALARRAQIEMLKNRHEAIEHSLEAIAVADRVGDVFANVNARINLFTARSAEGIGPDADTVLDIVEAATSVGAHEEAYRAIVNFVWSGVGFLPVRRVEEIVVVGREGRLPPPPIIADYLQLSVAAMLYVPAGRWAEADAILDRIDGSQPQRDKRARVAPDRRRARAPARRPRSCRRDARRVEGAGPRERRTAADRPDGLCRAPLAARRRTGRRASGRRRRGDRGSRRRVARSPVSGRLRACAGGRRGDRSARRNGRVAPEVGRGRPRRASWLHIARRGGPPGARDRQGGRRSARPSRCGRPRRGARFRLRRGGPQARPGACARSRGGGGRGGGDAPGGRSSLAGARLRQPVLACDAV